MTQLHVLFSSDSGLFEGGGATLPEYASREGWGVEVPDPRRGASRAPGAKKACKKHVKPYKRTRFASLKDALFLAPGMRTVIRNYIFNAFWKKFVEFTKSEKSYTTVRSAPLKDVLVKGAGIGAATRFYTFKKFWKFVAEIVKIKLAYTKVRFASLKNAPVRGA